MLRRLSGVGSYHSIAGATIHDRPGYTALMPCDDREPELGEGLDEGLLERTAADLGVPLSAPAVAALSTYAREIARWNERVNLTRLCAPDEMAVLHFADSLACFRVLPPRAALDTSVMRCIDVGAGAGLPGLPLKIACPSLRLTLLESTAKKAAFLRHVTDVLGLTDVSVVAERAEVAGRQPLQRETYDLAVARAVAELRVLAEYALPLLRVGGRLVALKGSGAQVELDAAAAAIDVLGGRAAEVAAYRLPGLNADRHAVAIDKIAPTPAAYPRRPGLPAKRPLR